MIHALNVGRLRTLKLWDSSVSLIWLDLIVEHTREMMLAVFGFSFNTSDDNLVEEDWSGNATETITNFFRHLRGLKDLFLKTPLGVDWNEFSSAIPS